MKKIIIVISCIIFCSMFFLWKVNKDYLLFWNANTLSVKVDKQLFVSKVKIAYSDGIIYDAETISQITPANIIFDGTQINEMRNFYGENDFIIIYEDKYYLTFRHYKTNRRHQHNYNFYFLKKEDEIFVKIKINGKNNMELEASMTQFVEPKNIK